ncbi:aldehyde dehydrogenase family protein [Enterococcus faecalis]|nr:aldehyde dehydrogenase family protein [Enterococcus faecalis]
MSSNSHSNVVDLNKYSGDKSKVAKKINVMMEEANNAQVRWRKKTVDHRVNVIKNFVNVLESNKKLLAETCSKETGKLFYDSIEEIEKSIEYVNYMCSVALSYESQLPSKQNEHEIMFFLNKPIGNVVGITAWNAPILLFMRKAIPALCSGCSICIKPSSKTLETAKLLAKMFLEIGLDNKILQIVIGYGEVVGEQLVLNQYTSMVSMTGSTSVGSQIMNYASKNIVKVNLELGGSSPVIVTENANIDNAVNTIFRAKLSINGQLCTSPARVYVSEGCYEEFKEKMIKKLDYVVLGDPFDPKVNLGPVISTDKVNQLNKLLEEAKVGGAIVYQSKKFRGNDYDGRYFPLSLAFDSNNEMRLMKEELFGPVLPIVKVNNIKQAIEFSNTSVYGLSSYVFTESIEEAIKVSKNLNIGEIYINTIGEESVAGFHSGWRKSGIGGADGINGYREYLETSVVYLNS